MNEDIFKNKNILNNIVDKIKNDMEWFNKFIDDSFEYQKAKVLK